MASAIAGHGRPVKPALSHDGELRAVASGETSLTEGLENPFIEPTAWNLAHMQPFAIPEIDFHVQKGFSGGIIVCIVV
ncbi:MAG: hypothetical protein NC242_02765 [Roseburia sp.]|nr:hypothetical protein [Roseburia sp.]